MKPGTTVRVELPAPHFSLLDTSRAGLPDVLVINDALMSFPHREIFRWHLEITIEARTLGNNGMPTREESAALDQLGGEIEGAIMATRTKHGSENILFLSRSTWNGQRELSYRVHEPAVVDSVLKALVAGANSREWEYEMREDAGWASAQPLFDVLRNAQPESTDD